MKTAKPVKAYKAEYYGKACAADDPARDEPGWGGAVLFFPYSSKRYVWKTRRGAQAYVDRMLAKGFGTADRWRIVETEAWG